MPADGPAVAVTVQEDDHGGEVVVMVDDELEVRESLAAFVHGGVNGGVDVVDSVDEIAPSRKGSRQINREAEAKAKKGVDYSLSQFLRHPSGILLAQFAHDDNPLIRYIDGCGLEIQRNRVPGADAPFPAIGILDGWLPAECAAEGSGVEAPEGLGRVAGFGVLAICEDDDQDDERGG